MNISKQVELTPGNQNRFQCFFVFEPSSARVQDIDVLYKGEEVQKIYDRLVVQLSQQNDIKASIILNRVSRIGQMLDLLAQYDNVVISKFFDRVWRRYSYISNIGELFLDYPTFIQYFPELEEKTSDLLAVRIDDFGDLEPDENEVDDSNDNQEKDTEEVQE